jgi:hypothetical protein
LLLGAAQLGIDDDFFEVGAHSLKQKDGLDLLLSTLIEAPRTMRDPCAGTHWACGAGVDATSGRPRPPCQPRTSLSKSGRNADLRLACRWEKFRAI